MQQEQEKAMREQFDKMVESGQMSREQADEQMEQSAQFVNNPMFMYLIPSISVFVIMLLWFFIFTTLAFLLAKFALKGEGGYSQAMTAMGLPLYISVLGSIILVIAGMLMGKMLTGLNPATLMGMDLKTLPGFLLSRLDLFTIWFYVVVGISFEKMFKSDNVKKYVITSLAAWLIFMFIIFGLAQAVPQLGGMLR
jgi:ABC-type transport system involved in cytochrome c biogenesis permease subunit